MPPDESQSKLSNCSANIKAIEFPLTVIAVVTDVLLLYDAHWWLGGAVGIGAVAWISLVLFRFRRKRVLPSEFGAHSLIQGQRAYLRGPLAFEEGEQLLDRVQEVQRVLAMAGNNDFKFGYINGPAGSGKTTLLQAGVVPGLRQSGWTVAYVRRLGDDPIGALFHALGAGPQTGRAKHDRHNALLDVARDSLSHTKSPRGLMMVIDQFEDLFALPKHDQRRTFLASQIAACLESIIPSVKVLIGVRNEFVADLLEFASDSGKPLDDPTWRFPLPLWDPDTALRVLKEAAKHDDAPFAETLMTEMVADLTDHNEVRPVELQLVATALNERRVYAKPGYDALGGARQILIGYVTEAIEANAEPRNQLYRQVARYLLRALCAEDRDTRRATGLSHPELLSAVSASIRNSSSSQEEITQALDKAIKTCKRYYLVVEEEGPSYNLANDYVVQPIRRATADLDTQENIANRLLRHYLEQRRLDKSTTIPLSRLRSIKQFASPERLSQPEAIELLRSSRRRLYWIVGTYAIGSLIVAAAAFPPGIKIAREEIPFNYSQWILSEDRRVAAAVLWPYVYDIWKVGSVPHDWTKRSLKSAALSGFLLSPTGRIVGMLSNKTETTDDFYSNYALQFLDSDIAEKIRESGFPWKAAIDHVAFSREFPTVGLSSDEQALYIVKDEGSVELGLPRTRKGWRVFKPAGWSPPTNSSGDAHSDMPTPPVPVDQLPRPFFSPRGKWLIIYDGRQWFHLVLVQDPPQHQTFGRRKPDTTGVQPLVAFSEDDKKLAVLSETTLDVFDLSPNKLVLEHSVEPLPSGSEPSGAAILSFSPDAKAVVWRTIGGDFFAADLTGPLKSVATSIGAYLLRAGHDQLRPVEYSKNSEWVVGNEWGAFVLWKVGAKQSKLKDPLGGNAGGFSPDSTYFVAHTFDNQFVEIELDQPSVTVETVGGQCGSNFLFSSDGRYIFTFGQNDICWGELGGALSRIARLPSAVTALAESPDQKELFAFCDRNLVVLTRTFEMWRRTISIRLWPKLEDASPPVLSLIPEGAQETTSSVAP